MEVGANWIHGVRNETKSAPNTPTNPLWTLKQKCGLEGVFTTLVWEPGPLVVYDMNGNNITTELRYGDIEEAEEKIGANITSQQRDGLPDRSIRSALMDAGWNSKTSADNFLDFMFFNFGHANSAEKLSLYRKETTHPDLEKKIFMSRIHKAMHILPVAWVMNLI